MSKLISKLKKVLAIGFGVAWRLAASLALLYVGAWGVTFARSHKTCIAGQFEITEVTYDFQPYCAGLYRGTVLVVPVQRVQDALNSRGTGF